MEKAYDNVRVSQEVQKYFGFSFSMESLHICGTPIRVKQERNGILSNNVVSCASYQRTLGSGNDIVNRWYPIIELEQGSIADRRIGDYDVNRITGQENIETEVYYKFIKDIRFFGMEMVHNELYNSINSSQSQTVETQVEQTDRNCQQGRKSEDQESNINYPGDQLLKDVVGRCIIAYEEFASSIPSDQKRQQYSSFRYQEMESINITDKGNQTDTPNNRKIRNSDPDYSPPRSQKRNCRRTKQTIKSGRLQAKGDDFSTDMSSDELESNNRLIFTTLQQPTAKIHVNNKRTRRNSNRRSKSNLEEGTSMDSSSYPSTSSSSEEDQRRVDRSNDNNPTMARPDMVHRTGKRECSIPYAWLEQRNSGTRNIVNQEEFETPAREDMLFPDGPKARKGRRFARKILRILNVSRGAIDMTLYGQRYNTQRRYYYAMEKLKKWTQINHYTILDLLSMKLHIFIAEVLAQFTSVNTSASSALQFHNGLSSMLLLTFDIDLKNNHMLQFTIKAISPYMIVKPKYEDTRNVGKLFDYWREKGSNRNLTNIELQNILTSLLMTICSMRSAENEGISLRHSVICEQTDKVDLRLQPKTKSGLHSDKLPKTRGRTVCPRATFFDWLERIDNKHGRSIRDNNYGTLWWNEDIIIPAKRGQILTQIKEITRLDGYKRKISIFIQTISSNVTSSNGSRRNVVKHIHRTSEKFKINK
ncbi:MAG: hypothetical protein EZS28_006553 [Streblomastix strix]|uniref:Tyr recombinase domain-containing protein n=1 Tax=Streblomastix strix TaxID=222440 RepID=A0A5J4WSM1_9EUKA|nr:MAG: hypothetical protein EZS28_006553 [Streblomastix strix]